MFNIQATKHVFPQIKYKFGNEHRSQMSSYLFLRRFCFPHFVCFILPWPKIPPKPWAPHYRGFIFIFRHTTFCKTPLGEWSARHRYLFLITHNTYKWNTSTHLRDTKTHSHYAKTADPQFRTQWQWNRKLCLWKNTNNGLPLITHFAPERVTFNYPQYRRVLQYRKNLYKDKIKQKFVF